MTINENLTGSSRAAVPRGVVMLGIVSLFMDMSSEMVHSLLPALFVTVLGANMAVVGVIEGIAEATAAIIKVFSGGISDWLGKRKILAVIGYGLGALSKPLFPLAATVSVLFAARFLDRIGKGIRGAPRDALVADLTPPSVRGAAYGLRQSLDTVGAFTGPLCAIGLMTVFSGDIRLVLWFAVIPAALCMAVLVIGVQEPASHQAEPRPLKFPINKNAICNLPRAYWGVVVIGSVFSLARFSEAFLTLRAMELGLSVIWTPAVMVLMAFVFSLTAYPAGKWADRSGARRLLICGLVVLIVADVLLAAATTLPMAFLGIGLWGLHMGLTQGLLSSLVAQSAPQRLRGAAFGLFNLISGVTLLFASLLAGLIWEQFGATNVFLTAAGFAAVAAIGTACRFYD